MLCAAHILLHNVNELYNISYFQISAFNFMHYGFYMVFAALLLTMFFFFLKLIIFIACFLNNSLNFFIQSLPLYTLCLFFMLLNEDILDIQKPDGICSLIFLADKFSGLFLHPLIFSIIHSRIA